MGPKIFTVQECNACIPRLEAAFTEIDGIRERLRRTKSRIDVLEMLWGEEIHSASNTDRGEYLRHVEDLERAKQAFEAVRRRILDLEVVLKSVEAGVVDFHGVVEGRLVLLNWKRGEGAVEYYRHIDDGQGARLPIPAAYRAR